MHIPYRHLSEYQPVDIGKLRPGTSYKSLIEKRTHPIDTLIAQFGKIPDELQGIVPQTAINGSRWLVSPEVLMSEADVATATLIETAPDELGRRFEAI